MLQATSFPWNILPPVHDQEPHAECMLLPTIFLTSLLLKVMSKLGISAIKETNSISIIGFHPFSSFEIEERASALHSGMRRKMKECHNMLWLASNVDEKAKGLHVRLLSESAPTLFFCYRLLEAALLLPREVAAMLFGSKVTLSLMEPKSSIISLYMCVCVCVHISKHTYTDIYKYEHVFMHVIILPLVLTLFHSLSFHTAC